MGGALPMGERRNLGGWGGVVKATCPAMPGDSTQTEPHRDLQTATTILAGLIHPSARKRRLP